MTWEAEIRRIEVGNQPGQKVLETSSQTLVVHISDPSYREGINRRIMVPGQPGQTTRSYLKNN
jgi:hypothetical protein